jgi:hypothetical protein
VLFSPAYFANRGGRVAGVAQGGCLQGCALPTSGERFLRTARISALRQLVLQVPAPVIAGALGFHHTTTTRQHVKAAGPWSQYAGGDREP